MWELNSKYFIKYLINKFSDIKDYVHLIGKQSDIGKIIVDIFKEVNIDDDELNLQIIRHSVYGNLDFYFESLTPKDRVKSFAIFLKESLQKIYGIGDSYYDNRKIIENALEEYNNSFAIKQTSDDIFEEMLKSNRVIALQKFRYLQNFSVAKSDQQIIIVAPTGVGKTVMAKELVSDIIVNNNDVWVLYFGSPEVNKPAFMKRIMVTQSNEPINNLFNEQSINRNKINTLRNIILIFDQDKQSSLKWLIDDININKYYTLQNEEQDTCSKIEYVKSEINNAITYKNEASLNTYELKIQENHIKQLKTQQTNLQLKKRENLKTLISYLLGNQWSLRIVKLIVNYLRGEEKAVEKINVKKDDFKWLVEYNFNEDNTIKIPEDESFTIENVIDSLSRIITFLKFLSKDWSEFYTKELRENLKELFIEQSNELQLVIQEQTRILKEEYQKVNNFLGKEYVKIHDNLNINFIESTIQKFRAKNPDKLFAFIIDYQQNMEGIPEDRAKASEFIGKKVERLSLDYNAMGIIFSQSNTLMANGKGKEASYDNRPYEFKNVIRDGNGILQKLGSAVFIYNRDMHTYPNDYELPLEQVDQTFVIYEHFIRKNRYDSRWTYSTTRTYFILNKNKMLYLPVSKRWYHVLDENKDILFLDQLIWYLKNKKGLDVSQEDIIE